MRIPLFPLLLLSLIIPAETKRMASANQEPRVLISGGGPSGLLAAILLNNIGVSSIVVERAKDPDEWSSKSYTLVLDDKGMYGLERGGCLDSARAAGSERRFVYIFDGRTGEVKILPKKTPGIGFTRPLLVECIEKIAIGCPRILLKRGVGLSSVVAKDDELGLCAHLEDGTVISATHVIGADGKWSKVRQSSTSLNSQAKMITCPSFGVHLNSPTIPICFKRNGTYVINPRKECMFYIVASPHPSGGLSISMVCYDETLERYPWLEPQSHKESGDCDESFWDDQYSALPETMGADKTLSQHLQNLFQEEMPEFYNILDKETFRSARVNRRTQWLQMSAIDGNKVSYSTVDGKIALIGDAAHAMTPSMGEGCNTALVSAVKLVDSISSVMGEKGESTCSVDTLSEGFVRYGSTRPTECIPVQEESQARNVFRKAV
jgi:2-polyprenyl-6-methoxyphenol hydroxylase-like FAD-dependent oxidoreductase